MLAATKQTANEAIVSPILMAFTEFGQKSSKPPLILLHGLFSRRAQWDTVGKKMASEMDTPVIAVDLRNHGDSPWTQEFSHPHIVADLEHLLQHIGAKNAHLLGHGFGGRTVVQCALQKPDLPKSIIVSESTPFGTPPGFWRLASILKMLKEIPIDPNAKLEDVKKQFHVKLRPKIRSHLMRKLFLSNLITRDGRVTWHFNLDSILNNLEAACRLPDLRPDSTSTIPALFVCGEASDSLPKYHLNAVMKLFPSSTVAYAGGAGYKIFQDRPGFFSEFVSDFVKKNQTK